MAEILRSGLRFKSTPCRRRCLRRLQSTRHKSMPLTTSNPLVQLIADAASDEEAVLGIAALILRDAPSASRPHSDGRLPLQVAVIRGFPRVTEALIDAGANQFAAESATGATLLHAAAAGAHAEVARVLVRHFLHPPITHSRVTPLMLAAKSGDVATVVAVHAGHHPTRAIADRDQHGNSALDWAEAHGKTDVAACLGARGCRPYRGWIAPGKQLAIGAAVALGSTGLAATSAGITGLAQARGAGTGGSADDRHLRPDLLGVPVALTAGGLALAAGACCVGSLAAGLPGRRVEQALGPCMWQAAAPLIGASLLGVCAGMWQGESLSEEAKWRTVPFLVFGGLGALAPCVVRGVRWLLSASEHMFPVPAMSTFIDRAAELARPPTPPTERLSQHQPAASSSGVSGLMEPHHAGQNPSSNNAVRPAPAPGPSDQWIYPSSSTRANVDAHHSRGQETGGGAPDTAPAAPPPTPTANDRHAAASLR